MHGQNHIKFFFILLLRLKEVTKSKRSRQYMQYAWWNWGEKTRLQLEKLEGKGYLGDVVVDEIIVW